MEGILIPKRLNGIANQHDPTQRAGLGYIVKCSQSLRTTQIYVNGSPKRRKAGSELHQEVLFLGRCDLNA
jgi:hypothetical protein